MHIHRNTKEGEISEEETKDMKKWKKRKKTKEEGEKDA